MSDRPTRIPHEEVAEIVTGWATRAGYAQHIAERYGIPVASAYRWIAETRRRGLLPDGLADRPCRYCGGTGVVRWQTRQRP